VSFVRERQRRRDESNKEAQAEDRGTQAGFE
jgi:hypothetical protein